MVYVSLLIFMYCSVSYNALCSDDLHNYKKPSAPTFDSFQNQSQLQQIVIGSDSIIAISAEQVIPEAVVVNLARREQGEERDNHHSYLRDLCCLAATTCNVPARQCRNEMSFIGETCSSVGNGCGRSLVTCCQLPRDACSCITNNMPPLILSALVLVGSAVGILCIFSNSQSSHIPSCDIVNALDDLSQAAPARSNNESSCISNRCCYLSDSCCINIFENDSEADVYC